ncbi:MAG: hypothetical protein ACRBK7_30175 [Acidimicrobiales bacterium]
MSKIEATAPLVRLAAPEPISDRAPYVLMEEDELQGLLALGQAVEVLSPERDTAIRGTCLGEHDGQTRIVLHWPSGAAGV